MKIDIIGAGCVGSVIAERLQQNGQEVSFIVNKERAEFLKQNGIELILRVSL